MPITIYSEADIAAQALAYLRNRFPGKASDSESFLGKLARVFAQVALGVQKAVLDLDNDSVPSTKSSTAALDGFAVLFGVSNGAGGYGRKGPVIATGGQGPITGVNGTAYTQGMLLVAPDGVTQFQLASAVTIPGSAPATGSITGSFSAVTAGSVGNQALNTTLTWVSPPSGSDATVKLSTSAITGGLDTETDAALLARILLRLQSPPKGGTSADFRGWGEGVTGVLRCYPYPLRGGLGTVHLVPTQSGSGTARAPSTTVQGNISTAINGSSASPGLRTVTAQGYATVAPWQPAYPSGGLTIRLRARASKAKYGATSTGWDWDDTGGPYTVASYNSGAGAGGGDRVTLNIAPPTSLLAASAATPLRVQFLVSTAGGSVIPIQMQVVAASAGAKTIDLINPNPTGWVAPSVGDAVYAGSSICTPIATAVLAYLDGLGPSRAGGYADVNDVWEDTADTGRIGQIALDTLDTDGTRYISGFVQAASVNQITIANGSGAASTGNWQARDTGSGPELLYARFVVVTQ